jgi:hypothetical protein
MIVNDLSKMVLVIIDLAGSCSGSRVVGEDRYFQLWYVQISDKVVVGHIEGTN